VFDSAVDDKTGSLLLLVMDGHGEFGHKVSAFLKACFAKTLFAEPSFASDVPTALREVNDRSNARRIPRDPHMAPETPSLLSTPDHATPTRSISSSHAPTFYTHSVSLFLLSLPCSNLSLSLSLCLSFAPLFLSVLSPRR
jgi:hypothetical protein